MTFSRRFSLKVGIFRSYIRERIEMLMWLCKYVAAFEVLSRGVDFGDDPVDYLILGGYNYPKQRWVGSIPLNSFKYIY
jgi:hypothetical protein